MCRQGVFPRTSVAALGTDALAGVGPLLCLYPSRGGELSAWRSATAVCAESCVDTDGVRESLRFLDAGGRSCLRLFLLPDSDYGAWESVRARLPCVAGESRSRVCAACTLYRLCTGECGWQASLLRVMPGAGERGASLGWAAVSEIGRGLARRIALAEGVAPPVGA